MDDAAHRRGNLGQLVLIEREFGIALDGISNLAHRRGGGLNPCIVGGVVGRQPDLGRLGDGRRVYVRHDQIPRVRNGYGIAILSTSRGVMTDREARKQVVGGELLCEVW